MSLTFIGPSGTIERRWIVYAMLRDNVQHHLEGGRPSGEFDALHGMADALLYGETTVSAATLFGLRNGTKMLGLMYSQH